MKRHTFEEIDSHIQNIVNTYPMSPMLINSKRFASSDKSERAEFLVECLSDILKDSQSDEFSEYLENHVGYVIQAVKEITLAYKLFSHLDYLLIAMAYGDCIRYNKYDDVSVRRIRKFLDIYLLNDSDDNLEKVLRYTEKLLSEMKSYETEQSKKFDEIVSEIVAYTLIHGKGK